MIYKRLAASATLLLAVTAMPSQAQHLTGGGSPDVSIGRVVAALAMCIAAAIGIAVVLHARTRSSLSARDGMGKTWRVSARWKPRPDGGIRVIEARRISQFADMCLVRCGTTDYLLVCGAAGVRLLDRKAVEQVTASDAG